MLGALSWRFTYRLELVFKIPFMLLLALCLLCVFFNFVSFMLRFYSFFSLLLLTFPDNCVSKPHISPFAYFPSFHNPLYTSWIHYQFGFHFHLNHYYSQQQWQERWWGSDWGPLYLSIAILSDIEAVEVSHHILNINRHPKDWDGWADCFFSVQVGLLLWYLPIFSEHLYVNLYILNNALIRCDTIIRMKVNMIRMCLEYSFYSLHF